jgi:uncharacterized protein with FMN-binding domain
MPSGRYQTNLMSDPYGQGMSTGQRPRHQPSWERGQRGATVGAVEYLTQSTPTGRWRLVGYPIMAILALALLFGFKAPAGSSAALPPAAQVRGTPAPSSPSDPAAKTSGTFTGAVVQDPYGQVQVQVTLAGGKITNVTAVQLPSQGRSGFISQSVAPILQGEAISAQSASIDTVSGATYTSQAYAQSLQSALDAAHA